VRAQTPRASFRDHRQHSTEELLDRRLLGPPSRTRQRLKLISPWYYRHERRLIEIRTLSG
jgi:hypothetical protein